MRPEGASMGGGGGGGGIDILSREHTSCSVARNRKGLGIIKPRGETPQTQTCSPLATPLLLADQLSFPFQEL
jgi:hypothetical protein